MLLFLVAMGTSIQDSSAQTGGDLYELDLRELSQLRTSSGAALTRTEAGKVPAAVTTITRKMIAESGARSLDELLEIYVPNLMRLWVAGGAGPKVGVRGIMGGRNHKTLILVNGRIANQRTIYGAISERFVPLFGDIESIEVVRGPGSSVYGPGAINGVISIKTLTRASDGVTTAFRQGFVEGYTLGEVRFAHALGSQSNFLGYYGVADYRGSDAADSPLVFSKTKSLESGVDLFTAGVPIYSGILRDNKALEGKPLHKAHLEYRHGNSLLWARLVRGGILQLPARSFIESQETFESNQGLRYQQLTMQGEQALKLSRRSRLQLRAGYDIHDIVKDPGLLTDREYAAAFREDELNLRSLLSWTPHDDQSVAVGLEFSREWFGKKPFSLTDDPAHNVRTDLEPWTTNMIGFLGEYQWNATPRWTAFFGGRMDRHTFTQWMFSPKSALVFSPNASNTAKLLYNRSVRKSDDIELKQQHDANPDFDGEIEKVDALELRHEYRANEELVLSAAAFWQSVDIIGWTASANRSSPVGKEEIYGLEAGMGYRGSRHDMTLSYAFTKLRDFTLADETIATQTESSAPYGFGNDLHHWPWHVGKLTWSTRLSRNLRALSSLRLFWGFKGAEDYAEYNNEVLQRNSLTRTDDGRTDAFEGNAFLNVGTVYDVGRRLQLSLHAHNILGWLQYDVNKRNFFGRMAGYRSEAPAISIRLGSGL